MDNKILNSEKSEFKVYDAALATLLFVIFNVVFMESFVLFASVKGLTNFTLWLAQFLVEALFGVASVVVAKINRVNLIKASGMDKKISIYMIIYSVLISIVSIIFFAGLTNVFVEFLTLVGYQGLLGSMPVYDFKSYIAYVFAVCVVPAVCEELLFRGTIQAGLKRFGKWVAILVSAFIFMIMHGGPEQTIHQFIIGVITGFIFFETGNLWLGVIIHFFNNFISVTELFFFNTMMQNIETEGTDEIVQTLSNSEMWSQFMVDLLVSLVFAAIGYVIVKKLIQKLIEENNKVNGQTAIETLTDNKTILVDGEVVETEFNVSDSEDEELARITKKEVPIEKPVLDKTSLWLFAIPIAWLVLQWFSELISGFLR